MVNDLLLEILVEEMPGNGVTSTIKQLNENIVKNFNESQFEYDGINIYATARRLVVYVKNLKDTQAESKKEVKGPAVQFAYDEKGNPTKALLGFLNSNKVELKDITTQNIKGIEYIYLNKVVKGESIFTQLNDVLKKSLQSLIFGKTMTWSDCKYRFVRPVRNVLLKYGKENLPFEFDGQTNLGKTFGHRVLSNYEITIEDACTYLEVLQKNFVIVDQAQRKQLILKQFENLEKENNITIEKDEELLDEVNFLVEYPTAFVGSFEKEFLQLPDQAIIVPMKVNQRYFPVYQNGKLLNNFIGVRNGDDFDLHLVVQGNERVLRARLCDAKFFYQEDLTKGLNYFASKLNTVVYRKKLGTIQDKVNRISFLSNILASELQYTNLEKLNLACSLCKADLVSGMVNEFEELQGVMGKAYALSEKIDADVAESIYSHYFPRSAYDEVATDMLGIIIGLADRIDSVCGAYATGVIPTGSKDQFGTRRDVIGILNLCLKNNLNLDLNKIIKIALEETHKIVEFNFEDVYNQITSFIENRLKNILSEKYDVGFVNAFISNYHLNITKQNFEIFNKMVEFSFKENFIYFVKTLKRASNLVKSTEGDLTFLSEEEKELLHLSEQVDILKDNFAFTSKLESYLDTTLVLCEDKNISRARQKMLSEIINNSCKEFNVINLEV